MTNQKVRRVFDLPDLFAAGEWGKLCRTRMSR